jgi:hypothetical protein
LEDETVQKGEESIEMFRKNRNEPYGKAESEKMDEMRRDEEIAARSGPLKEFDLFEEV